MPKISQRYGGFSPSVCFSLQKLCSSQLQGSRRRARSSFAPSRTSFNFFTLFFSRSPGNPLLLVKRQYYSGCWAVLSHEKVGKDMQGVECPKSALLSQNGAHSDITKSGDVRAAEVRARLDSLRIGAHRDSALNQPIIRTEKCTENIDIDFSKKRLWDPFIRPGKKRRVLSNVLFFWIQCYPFRPDCISRSPEIFLF